MSNHESYVQRKHEHDQFVIGSNFFNQKEHERSDCIYYTWKN